ncbi:MAG: hypothetical protein RLZZ26_56 [Candidatus Parcubacteria bacterium]|jgi:hypothetical protein
MSGSSEQINLEYIFRSLYGIFHGSGSGSGSGSALVGLQAYLAHLWLGIIVAGYAISVLGLAATVYMSVKLFELRKREEEFYSTLIVSKEASGGVSPRWKHIESLIGESSPSFWREAIIEADIMLDDALGRRGYVGDGVGEKLKAATEGDLHSLQDAWDVHKIRNQVAHEGSTFELSETLARRTVMRYETVLRELKAI